MPASVLDEDAWDDLMDIARQLNDPALLREAAAIMNSLPSEMRGLASVREWSARIREAMH